MNYPVNPWCKNYWGLSRFSGISIGCAVLLYIGGGLPRIGPLVSQTKQTEYTLYFRPKWQNLYPISDYKSLKMIPFGAAHMYLYAFYMGDTYLRWSDQPHRKSLEKPKFSWWAAWRPSRPGLCVHRLNDRHTEPKSQCWGRPWKQCGGLLAEMSCPTGG